MKKTQDARLTVSHVVRIWSLCLVFAGFLTLSGAVQETQARPAGEQTCNVKKFGAVGDGIQRDTVAIQSAIDACASYGSGIVKFPPGTYLSAPLFLKSGVTLLVQVGATLLASQDPADYIIPIGVVVATPLLAFINAYGVNDIGITGGGVIDGNGAPWWAAVASFPQRPRLIELAHANSINIDHITLQNSPSMHLFLSYTNAVHIAYITITAPATSPNTDGIDPASSHNVHIDHCLIDTGDDNIAVKSGKIVPGYPDAGSSNINIDHCQFLHGHGVSIGSETNGGVQNVSLSDSTFNGTENGLRIKSTRSNGGNVGGVTYRHLTMTNVKHPILFSGYYPHIPPAGTDPAQPVTATTPYFHDLLIDDLVATGSADAGNIVGVPEDPFTNIQFLNVHISATTGMVLRNATLGVDNSTITVSTGSPYIIQEQAVLNADS